MEFVLTIAGVSFGILFIAFIFIKSYIDDKKQKKIMAEIFTKYGVKTNAKILNFSENHTYGKYIPGKYNYCIEFHYLSSKAGTLKCSYNLPTNNQNSKKYTDEIPIIYIPAYIDYHKNLISSKELFSSIGYKLNLGYDCYLIMFAEDIRLFTTVVPQIKTTINIKIK